MPEPTTIIIPAGHCDPEYSPDTPEGTCPYYWEDMQCCSWVHKNVGPAYSDTSLGRPSDCPQGNGDLELTLRSRAITTTRPLTVIRPVGRESAGTEPPLKENYTREVPNGEDS